MYVIPTTCTDFTAGDSLDDLVYLSTVISCQVPHSMVVTYSKIEFSCVGHLRITNSVPGKKSDCANNESGRNEC